MGWQKYALTEMLRVNPNGSWAARTHGILVARQNGKSALMRLRLLAGLYLWDETWLSMAQNRQLSLEHFQKAIEVIDSHSWLSKKVKRVSRTNGKEYIELRDTGAKWSVVAATRDGARGFTGNLWVDEIRDVSAEAWKAATPITRAVPNAQIVFTSNAGDSHSSVLNDLRARSLTGHAKSINYMEWSADPQLPVTSEEAWLQANPAIGYTIDLQTIADAAASDPPEHFRTESLCLWVDNLESAWTFGSFEACANKLLHLDPDRPTFLAIDVTPDRRRADLVGAQQLDDGSIAFGIMDSWESDTTIDDLVVAKDVSRWAKQYPTQIIAFDKWTGASVASRLSMAGFPVRDTSGAIFAQSCDETKAAMDSKRLVHNGDEILTKHFAACARKTSADGGWRIIRRGTSTAISAACASVMAIHFASQTAPEPVIAFA